MIPRYLFRADSPGSDGFNGRTGFYCQASGHGNEDFKRLNDIDWAEARRMLQDHVLWHSWKTRQNDILISFSSSFLFVVQHCIRKINSCWKTTEDNCFITILDTQMYPNQTFQPTIELLRKYGLDDKDDKYLRHAYHEAEYLAEGQIRISTSKEACRIPFSSIQSSLYKIAPDLARTEHRRQLLIALNKFRFEWYLEPEAILQKDIDNAYELAGNFGGKWFIPMMVWALAMKKRSREDVLNLPGKLLLGTDDFPSPFMFEDQTRVPSTLRELKEWECLMETLFLQSGNRKGKGPGDPAQELLDSLSNLHIGEE